MTYENFQNLLEAIRVQDKRVMNFYDEGLNVIDFVHDYQIPFNILFKDLYGDEGFEMFLWYEYENDSGNGGLRAHDKDGNPICGTDRELWEYLENGKSNPFSNKSDNQYE